MDKTIPRWEWRAFMPQTDAEEKISKYPLIRQIKSSDVYILSELSADNVKVRNNIIDIKSLQDVTEDGLEQWLPVKKEPFPLALSEMQAIFKIFRVPMPEFAKGTCTFEEFVQLAKKDEHIICVMVHKDRRLYNVNGCLVEIADLKLEDETIMTVAIELENPDNVRATKRMFGFDRIENINYVTAIKRMWVHL